MTYQAQMEFFDGAGCRVTLMAKPADSVAGSILNLGDLRNTATYYGLTLDRPQTIIKNGGISKHKVSAVSRQVKDDENNSDIVFLFTEYFPDSLGRIYLNTADQRDEFREATGIDISSLQVASSNRKADKAVLSCKPFDVVKIQTGLDDRNNPKYRFEFVSPSSTDMDQNTDGADFPDWLKEHRDAFVGICARYLGKAVPEFITDSFAKLTLEQALNKMPSKKWSDFASGKEAGQALIDALNPTPPKSSTNDKVDRALDVDIPDRPVPTGDENKSSSTGDVLKTTDAILLTVQAKTSFKGVRWHFKTMDGKDIIMDNLGVFVSAGWDISTWKTVGNTVFVGNITCVIDQYVGGWKIRELKMQPPPVASPKSSTDDKADRALDVDIPDRPVPTDSEMKGDDAEFAKLEALVNATLMYPVEDVWEILNIPDPRAMSVDAVHALVIDRIREYVLPIAPHMCKFFKDGTKNLMLFSTPIGLALRMQAGKTWFKEQLGDDVYQARFKDWTVGKKSEPSVYKFAKDELFYLTWQKSKSSTPSQPLRVVGASMSIPTE
jgi:hypothetical protein